MTPEEQHLVFDKARLDPDYQEHTATYFMFTRIMKAAAFVGPFFFAFVLYWTD